MSKRKKVLIGFGIGFGVLLLLLMIVAVLMRGGDSPQLPLLPEATPTSSTLTPLEQKVKALNDELKGADPTKQDIPFPPVDLEIRLDEPTKQ